MCMNRYMTVRDHNVYVGVRKLFCFGPTWGCSLWCFGKHSLKERVVSVNILTFLVEDRFTCACMFLLSVSLICRRAYVHACMIDTLCSI